MRRKSVPPAPTDHSPILQLSWTKTVPSGVEAELKDLVATLHIGSVLLGMADQAHVTFAQVRGILPDRAGFRGSHDQESRGGG